MGHIEMENQKELFQAQAHIWNHIFGYINSMSLRCAVQLGIPDIVHNHQQPITLSELVMKLSIPKTKTAHLFRVMRLLVHSGFFAIQNVCNEDKQEEGYVLTASSRLLLKDHPKSAAPLVQGMLDPIMVSPSYFLSAWFQGDDLTAFETAHGKNIWDFASQENGHNNFFNEAMASDARMIMSVVVTECKDVFQGLKSIVDVGGGTGTMAKTIAETFPSLKCTVFDLPHVVATTKKHENITYIAGDVFENSIPHADAILLKWILHDWPDEQCVQILKACKEAISSGSEGEKPGKVILIDMVVDEKNVEPKFTETQLLCDILIMTQQTGKERTEKEWDKLFKESGFSQYKITPVLGLRSVMELYP